VANLDHLSWLADLTAADLDAVGIITSPEERPAAVALAEWAGDYGVDLGHVHDSLVFLQSGPHVLLAPSPLALMAFSPRRQTFRASFDLAFPPEMAHASIARAGAWLTVLAAEVRELPTTAGDWLLATVGGNGLEGPNVGILAWVEMYGSVLMHRGIADVLDDPLLCDYNRQMCSALWRCAAYALR
jgi:hypothetical protein